MLCRRLQQTQEVAELPEQALAKAAALPGDERDAIASQIIEIQDDEAIRKEKSAPLASCAASPTMLAEERLAL